MKNRLEFFSLAIFTLLLSACSGSDQAPPNTQTVVNVSNQTASNFSQVSIEEHLSGKVFEAKSFSCPARQTDCKLYYTGAVITGPVVAIFKDSRGHTVGIYDVDHAPGKYIAPEVTLWSTGAYLYEALVNEKSSFASMTEAERQAVLGVFVSDKRAADKASAATTGADSTNHISHYEALALSFLNQQINGPVTVSAYVQNLAKRLSQREVAPLAEFSSPTHLTTVSLSYIFHIVSNRLKSLIGNDFIRSAQAATTPPCGKDPKAAVALVQLVTGGIAVAFPEAAVVAKTTSSVVTAACDETGAKIDDILDKLNAVKNALNNLTSDLNKLAQFLANDEANQILQKFTNVSEDLTRLAGDYKVILGNNKVSSIQEYVQKVGGNGADALKNILREEPDGVFENLLKKTLGTSDQNYILQIKGLTEDKFDSLRSALELLCKNPEFGDVVEARVRCNLIISSSTSRLIAAQTIAYQLASETYDLLETYPSEASRYGYELSKTAITHKSELRDNFNNQTSSMISKFQKTLNSSSGSIYYDPLAGLPQAMLLSIREADCSGTTEYPGATISSISGWVKESSGDEFLITKCKNDTIPILSRYYIRTSGVDSPNRDSVTNILGVLIPSANKNLWFGKLHSAETQSFKMLAMRYADRSPRPLSFAFNGQNFRENNTPLVVTDVDKSGPASRLQEWTKPWSNGVLRAPGLTLFNLPFGSEERVNHWMRFTDESGYSYAFSFEVWGAPTFEFSRLWLNCATVECSDGYRSEGDLWWNGLFFKKGPQNLSFRNAETPNSARFSDGDRRLYGWIIGTSFIDAQ